MRNLKMEKISAVFPSLLICLLTATPAVAGSEIINGTYRVLPNDAPLVIDLPEEASRSEAVEFISTMQGRFFSRLKVVDSTAIPNSRLKDELGKGFVIYGLLAPGTLTSKVLSYTFGSLDFSSGWIKTPYFKTHSANLRIICAGKNPYGTGPVLVYCAENNELINNINSVFHGPKSYYVYDGDRLLYDGYYSDKQKPSK